MRTPCRRSGWNGQTRSCVALQTAWKTDVRKATASGLDGVYVIVDPGHTNGRSTVDVAGAALSGGAIAIQLRRKGGPGKEVLDEARRIREMCAETGALFIVNDYSDVARIVDSDGLHVGQGDLPVAAARQVLSPHQIVGTSNALVQEALDSEAETADYIAVGSIFPDLDEVRHPARRSRNAGRSEEVGRGPGCGDRRHQPRQCRQRRGRRRRRDQRGHGGHDG